MQAIILAGGFGTRLKSVTGGEVPKPMAPIAGRPFLAWLLDYMRGQGVSEAMLCLHHQREAIQDYFGDDFNGMRIGYSVEEAPLGTGGGIRRAMRQLNPEVPLFVLNGDSLVQLDYRAMYVRHIASGKRLSMAAAPMSDCGRYGQLAIEEGEITGFLPAGTGAGHISTGFYVASPDLFDAYTLPDAFSFEHDFLTPYVPELKPEAFTEVEYFIDIGVPEDYALAQHTIPERVRQTVAA